MDEINSGDKLPRTDLSAAESDVVMMTGTPEKNSLRKLLSVCGWGLALGGLLWTLHDLKPGELRAYPGRINWWLIAGALSADTLSYLCQGWRWQQLLKSVEPIPLLQTTRAIYVGLFVNEILPLRPGEMVRAFLIARQAKTKVITIVPSLVVERLFDAIWLTAGVGLTAMFVPLPEGLKKGSVLLGLTIVSVMGLCAGLALRQRDSDGKTSSVWPTYLKLWRPVVLLSGQISEALSALGRTRIFYLSFLLSSAFLLLQMAAFWLAIRGCGIALSFPAGAAVFLLVHLGTTIPNAPANIGSYQFFTILGLTFFGVSRTVATSFSLVVFVLLTLPLLALGFLAISYSGVPLAALKQHLCIQETLQ